jgi:drug/metabolite transporter (DMT)-like permease
MIEDRPLLGISLMLGFCVLAPLGDTFAKLLGGAIPLAEIVLIRFAIQVIIVLPVIWLTGRSLATSPRVLVLAGLRTLVHILAMGLMFTALWLMPLADVVAILFVMPFITLLLGWLALGETAGPRRVAACAVGFAGTLLVIQPNFAALGPVALLPLIVALLFSIVMLLTRQIAKHIDALSLQGISGLMATAFMIAAFALTWNMDLELFAWAAPSPRQMFLLLMVGLVGTLAHIIMTLSLRFAPASTLAPMQYTEIPVATFLGWLIFKDLPDALASLGIAITMGAGLYVIYREQINARARFAQT